MYHVLECFEGGEPMPAPLIIGAAKIAAAAMGVAVGGKLLKGSPKKETPKLDTTPVWDPVDGEYKEKWWVDKNRSR